MVVPVLETLVLSVGSMASLAAFAIANTSSGDVQAERGKNKKTKGVQDPIVDKEEIEELVREVSDRQNLPLHQVRMYWKSFERYDLDASGSVDSNELAKMLVDSIGYMPTPEDLAHLIRDVDSDGSGTLEFPEFCQLVAKMDMGEQTTEELREAFHLWSEGKPSISGALVRNALMNFGDKMSSEEVDAFMADADVDNDGTIDYEEFVRAMAWRTEKADVDQIAA